MESNFQELETIISYGEALFNEGKIEDAEKHFLNILSQHPSNPAVNNNLGAIKYSQGHMTIAKEFLLTALAYDVNNIDALANLKEVYKNYNAWQKFPQSLIDAKELAQFFTEAVTLAPESPDIISDIGLLQFKAGQLDKAEQSFLTAINMAPSHQEAFYNLGRILMSHERYAEAVDNFIAAILINSENEIAQRAAIEYLGEEVIKRIGDKYKNILIVMEEGAKHVQTLEPAIKAIKGLHKECHITFLGCESAISAIQKLGIIDRVITKPDDRIYDIALLTIWSSIFISLHRSWLIKNCKQFFFSSLLKGQNVSDSHFHIARCLGYTENKSGYPDHGINEYKLHSIDDQNNKSNMQSKNYNALNSKKQFFIGGTGRSGTSILMKILNGHFELASFGEVKVLMNGITEIQNIMKQAPAYRENIVENFKNRWLNEYFEFIVNWQHDEKDDSRRGLFQWFDKTEVLQSVPVLEDLKQSQHIQSALHTFGAFIQNLFDQYALKNSKNYWVEKTPANAVWAPALSMCFPNLKIVNMIRDGRDVACSMQNMTWGIKDPYKAIDWWATELTKSLNAQKHLVPGSFLNIRYEDLVGAPEKTLKEIISFYNIDWDENLLKEPIYSKAIGRYKTELGDEVQEYALQKYGALLEQFNY